MPKCKCCKKKLDSADGVIVNLKRFCGYDCAVKWSLNDVKEARHKKQKKKDKERLAELRPASWYTKEAQRWFNKFIRLRDMDEPCICCGRPHDNSIQWHAGHFLTTGARPEHRFNEDNCHKQTSYCNNHLSGNVAEYRKRLIVKIGLDKVEAMECDHKPKKYTISDLKEIISTYKKKCKEKS